VKQIQDFGAGSSLLNAQMATSWDLSDQDGVDENAVPYPSGSRIRAVYGYLSTYQKGDAVGDGVQPYPYILNTAAYDADRRHDLTSSLNFPVDDSRVTWTGFILE
jgi:hypothetical protein